MSELKEYIAVILICSPILFFIVGVVFRLLDNSASIFLNNDIMVDSSYVSVEQIKKHITASADAKYKKLLQRALVFRKLHNLFMVLMVISLLPAVISIFIFFD